MAKEQYYDPLCTMFPYPEDTDKHYMAVKKNDGTVFDEHYPYIDDSKKAKRKANFFQFLLRVLVWPITRVKMRLKIVGKENLKKHKEEIDKGVVTVSNHVHQWDYICIMRALHHYRTRVVVWAPNIRGEYGSIMRAVGGIPIPENDLKATGVFFDTIINYIKNGGVLQIYPEGSMWEWYKPIRPFKPGMAYFSIKSGRPVLPLAFSYRRNNWIRRKIFNSPASFTLHIGEPIYPDTSLPYKEASEKLIKEVHQAVCSLAGIKPGENIYPPIFDHSKRIDYYATEYGKKK